MKTSQQLLQNGAAAVFCAHTINRWNIFLGAQTGLYDMTKEERLDAMRNMLKDRPVFVRDGNRADTFIISTKQESLEERRQKVLDKLTAEERKLLGV